MGWNQNQFKCVAVSTFSPFIDVSNRVLRYLLVKLKRIYSNGIKVAKIECMGSEIHEDPGWCLERLSVQIYKRLFQGFGSLATSRLFLINLNDVIVLHLQLFRCVCVIDSSSIEKEPERCHWNTLQNKQIRTVAWKERYTNVQERERHSRLVQSNSSSTSP